MITETSYFFIKFISCAHFVLSTEIRLQFEGAANVHWTETHGTGDNRRSVTYSSSELYFNQVVHCQSPRTYIYVEFSR
jgi:hypothetical protein